LIFRSAFFASIEHVPGAVDHIDEQLHLVLQGRDHGGLFGSASISMLIALRARCARLAQHEEDWAGCQALFELTITSAASANQRAVRQFV